MIENDTMMNRAYTYLNRRLKKARVSLAKAEEKPNGAQEIRDIQNKIEILEYLQGLVMREG